MDLGPSSVVALSSLERASRPLDAGFINGDYFKTKQSKRMISTKITLKNVG